MISFKHGGEFDERILKDGVEVGHIDWSCKGGKPKLRTTGHVPFSISELEAILEEMNRMEAFQVQYREWMKKGKK